MAEKIVEVEVRTPDCGHLLFLPLNRQVRGEIAFAKMAEPNARMKCGPNGWEPIPGQRIGVDSAGMGWVAEPLHLPANAETRRKIERRGYHLAPELETFADCDVPSWLFWLKRAVDSGLAHVVAGSLPRKIEGEPRKNFFQDTRKSESQITLDRVVAGQDRMASAFEKMAAAFEKVAARK